MPAFEEWMESLHEEAKRILEAQPDSFIKSDFTYSDSISDNKVNQSFGNESKVINTN